MNSFRFLNGRDLSIMEWFRSLVSSELEGIIIFLSGFSSYFGVVKATAASVLPEFDVMFSNVHVMIT